VQPSTVLASRFELVELASTARDGGGSIYRARDLETHAEVAIKILRLAGPAQAPRIDEALRGLVTLTHPAIVTFVAHGHTEDGRPFVATEWVHGESLRKRLLRGPLSVAAALALVRRVAEGLAFAHARGVVHFGVSPGSLLLPSGRVEDAKIADFGLVRLSEPTAALSGPVVGTPGFMAPEQVRGRPDVDSRADVFALGCVLFAALTGTHPFRGEASASLAKVLFERAPRAGQTLPDLPQAVDDLVGRMLAQEREDRPSNGTDLLARIQPLLDALRPSAPPAAGRPGRAGAGASDATTPSGGVLTIDEQRFVSIVVASLGYRPRAGQAGDVPSGRGGRGASAAAERARAAGAPFGARVELLADGTIVAALAGKGSARDQANQAARCALALRDVLEGASLALATGRAELGASRLVGEVIERAVGLLRPTEHAPPSPGKRHPPVAIDATTAGLLDAHFDVGGDGVNLGLRRERATAGAEGARTLLGRPTPFVGRDREMTTLDSVFRECESEGIAHAVLVTAPSGAGKSRLRHEFIRKLRSRDGTAPAMPGRGPHQSERVEIMLARGDPMSAGSPLGMIAQLVRDAAGVQDGETLRTRQSKLTARLSRHHTGEELARLTEFLGAIAGIRFPGTESVQYQAARRSTVLMGDQMRRAWDDFLAAECAAQPVLLILEDLHWGDLPTVTFLDGALRKQRKTPLMVMALAQPDVHRLFPDLWAGHPMTELRLGDLSPKAGEKLVRQVLGDRAGDPTIARVVEQAAGNAFYLEELIRSVAEGDQELPPTVLAMVQARLESLDPDARRVLRGASVFGSTFWKAGVEALLIETEGSLDIGKHLEQLTRREFVTAHESGRFPDEYVFRHAIVREAAYGMLTQADRRLGHGLAGAWLERAGENDAMVLAEHFERGGEPERALRCYEHAAKQALEANDLPGAILRAKQGIERGAAGEQRAALLVLAAEAHRWRGEHDGTESSLQEALGLLPPRTARRYDAISELISAKVRLGHFDGLDVLIDELCEEPADATALQVQAMAWARAAVPLVLGGPKDLAGKLFARIERAELDLTDPSLVARLHQARSTQALSAGDLYAYLKHVEGAAAAFDAAGDLRSACLQRSNAGYAKTTLGAYAEAEVTLREALISAVQLGLPPVAALVRQYLGLALAHRGALHEARVVLEQAIEGTKAAGEALMVGWSFAYLAELHILARNFDAAERAAEDALAALGGRVHEVRMYALAMLTQALLAMGRVDEALVASRDACEILAKLGTFSVEAVVLLARAEALRASGDLEAAKTTIRHAREKLQARAGKIGDPSHRPRFLTSVPAHARTLKLAAEWCD
jgi:tetratricopeptide (TPR) repeat protein